MKNKILIGALALMISSLAFASGDKCIPAPKYFDGFYAGLGLGVAHTMADVNSTTTNVMTAINERFPDDPLEVTLPTGLSSDMGKTGFNGNLFLGYGMSFAEDVGRPMFYLGGELFGQYTPVKMTAKANSDGAIVRFPPDPEIGYLGTYSTSIDVENDFAFGGAIRFGYLVTPRTMIYILGGAQYAQFKVDYNHSVNNLMLSVGSTIQQSINWKYSDTCWRAGFIPGVGIETMLTKNLSLRAQYMYVYYSSYSIAGNGPNNVQSIIDEGTTIDTTTTNAADVSVKPSQGSFTVGLTYHLNFL